jgi:hypothetical protein
MKIGVQFSPDLSFMKKNKEALKMLDELESMIKLDLKKIKIIRSLLQDKDSMVRGYEVLFDWINEINIRASGFK